MDSNVTYFSEFKTLKDVSSPITNNDVGMKYRGGFIPSWIDENVDFDNPSYGLKKTRESRGLIYCDDASKLFSMSEGQVDISFSLERDIVNGVLSGMQPEDSYVLWGVNVGQTGCVIPSINVTASSEGIKFTIWSSSVKFSIVDTVSNISKGELITLRCVWAKEGLDDFGGNKNITMYYKLNDTEIISNPPIGNDSIYGLNFCVGNTPFLNKNLDMTIGKLVTFDKMSYELEEEWLSSSSDTSISESSSTSSISDPSSSSSTSSSSSSSTSESSGGESSSSSSKDSSSSSPSSSQSPLSESSSSSSSKQDIGCQKVCLFVNSSMHSSYQYYIPHRLFLGYNQIYSPGNSSLHAVFQSLQRITDKDCNNFDFACVSDEIIAFYQGPNQLYASIGHVAPGILAFSFNNGPAVALPGGAYPLGGNQFEGHIYLKSSGPYNIRLLRYQVVYSDSGVTHSLGINNLTHAFSWYVRMLNWNKRITIYLYWEYA